MTTPYEEREELQRLVIAELLGPVGGPEEIVTESTVRDRYLLGMLAPKGGSALPEESDDAPQAGVDGEDGITDAPPPKATTSMLPSSIGMTFVVDGEAEALQITARWGRYERTEVELPDARDPDAEENEEPPEAPEPSRPRFRRVWRRVPMEGISKPIPLKPGRMPDWTPVPQHTGVVVQGLVRRRQDSWVITLFLINAQPEPKINKDTAWLFQPELSVVAPDGAPVFCKRASLDDTATLEARTMAMLYRHEVEFAVGHGVAVTANIGRGPMGPRDRPEN